MTEPPLLRELTLELRPDPARTVIRPFRPGGQDEAGLARLHPIVTRVCGFDDAALQRQLDRTGQSVDKLHAGTREASLGVAACNDDYADLQ